MLGENGLIMNMIFRTPMVDAFTGEPITRTQQSHPYNYQCFETFSNGEKGKSDVWTDRLWRWDDEKYNDCCKQVWGDEGQVFSHRSPATIEYFLRLYFDDDSIVLNRVVQSCNQANGFPVWYFAFTNADKEEG